MSKTQVKVVMVADDVDEKMSTQKSLKEETLLTANSTRKYDCVVFGLVAQDVPSSNCNQWRRDLHLCPHTPIKMTSRTNSKRKQWNHAKIFVVGRPEVLCKHWERIDRAHPDNDNLILRALLLKGKPIAKWTVIIINLMG